jgi:hypothetical protein
LIVQKSDELESEKLLKGLMQMVLPEAIIDHFEIESINETKDAWELVLYEKEDQIPLPLRGKNIVKAGLCNPVELHGFPVKGKAFYIKIYRRRWKEAGGGKCYDNQYDLHEAGMKATREFGAFLKENFRLTATKFSKLRRGLMH